MARPRSEDKRNAILEATIRVIAAQGLGASTASIAEEAGVASGTLFVYFKTKTELFNQLYLFLKSETVSGPPGRDPSNSDVRREMEVLWSGWIRWAVETPERRRALTLLGASNEITSITRQKAHEILSGVTQLIDQCRKTGPMRDAPLGLVVAFVSTLAETTIDYLIENPGGIEEHSQLGLDALWRLLK